MIIKILRQEKGSDSSYYQSFEYESRDNNETVATMLNNLNSREPLKDIEGNIARKITFKQSCLQKKCGACAMLINGKPKLACDTKISDHRGTLLLEPMKKFPVVEDLFVDRDIMQENLKMMKVYLSDHAIVNERRNEISYEASRCLECGICLEVCPNFMIGNGFTGMAGALPLTRIISQLGKEKLKEISETYKKHVYSDCGKSLSCVNACPVRIRIEDLLVNSNAVAVWKRYIKD